MNLYTSWFALREKLLETDKQVAKRHGDDYTLYVEIEDLKYDPAIPVLADALLEEWIVARKEGRHLPFVSKHNNDKEQDEGRDDKKEREGEKATKPKRLLVKKRPKSRCERGISPQRIPPPQNVPSPEHKFLQQNDFSQPGCSPDLSEESDDGENENQATRAIWKSNVDQLVIQAPIDDEFQCFDDDQEEETELSKNLKKIRAEPVKTTVQQSNHRSAILHPSSLQLPPTPISPSPPPPKVVDPNWSETRKSLDSNHFVTVYKDLSHFEDKIKSDTVARQLVRDTIIKCFTEDETGVLVDILNLIRKLHYYNEQQDVEFWSELVKRFKRKLNTHSNVKNFKTKTDPEWVYHNYKRAFLIARDYSQKANLVFTLQFNDLSFFMGFVSENGQKIPTTPAITNGILQHNDAKPDIKAGTHNCDPIKERSVTIEKNEAGKVFFKVTKARSTGATSFRKKF